MKRILGMATLALTIAACGEAGDKTDASKAGAESAAPAAAETATAAPATQQGTWGDIVYGDPNASVEMIEYASLTCPHCAHLANDIMPTILEKYVDTGKVKLIYRNFVMNRVDLAASTVARCGDMENTHQMMKLFFERQGEWSHAGDEGAILDSLARTARRAGMSRTEFDRCIANTDMHKHLVEMTQNGAKTYQINSTPSLFVNGAKLDNYAAETIEAALDAALK